MSAASDAYSAFLTKAAELQTLRAQGLALVDEMADLEKTIMKGVGPKGHAPYNYFQGEVTGFARRMMGLPDRPVTFDLVALAHGAYDRLF